MSARTELGQTGEQLAVEHLERLGFDVVARNHRTRYGELDVIARDDRTLVFVEVKTTRGSVRPWDLLHGSKREQVRRMAAHYLATVEDRPHGLELRFDAIGVRIDPRGRLVALDHLEGAF